MALLNASYSVIPYPVHGHKGRSNSFIKYNGYGYLCNRPIRLLVFGTSRLPHFLYNWFVDGSEFVSLRHRPRFTSMKIPGNYFFYRPSLP